VRIAVAADHNGVVLKAHLVDWLVVLGHKVSDVGSHGDDVVDYPPLCYKVGRLVVAGEADWGLVVGGSGQGEVIACNKVKGVRAGLGYSTWATEISRGHNNANVLVIGAKITGAERAEEILSVWMSTAFKGGRHQERVDQIAAIEG
jgi:ribose 5-phosphate isomerase B